MFSEKETVMTLFESFGAHCAHPSSRKRNVVFCPFSGVSRGHQSTEVIDMKRSIFVVAAAFAALIAFTAGSTYGAPLSETVTVAADAAIPNAPGKRLVSVIVDYAPGASSVPHRHASSAFIYAYVLSGEIRSQVDSEPARVYRAGEAWFENPGAYHRVSANASNTEPARLLAVFIADVANEQLTTPDPK